MGVPWPGLSPRSASSPQLKPTPVHRNRSTLPSTGSVGSRSLADSRTSITSLRNCRQDTSNRISETHRGHTIRIRGTIKLGVAGDQPLIHWSAGEPREGGPCQTRQLPMDRGL